MPRAASPRAALVALAFGAAARAEMVAMNIAVGAGWLAFEFDTLDGREAFEARAIRFAAENGTRATLDAETRVVRAATEAIVASAAMLNYMRGSKGYDTLVRRSMDIPARA